MNSTRRERRNTIPKELALRESCNTTQLLQPRNQQASSTITYVTAYTCVTLNFQHEELTY